MSEKKIAEVRADKVFRLRDLFVYGAVAAIIALLFLVTFLSADKSPANGIIILYRDAQVFYYDFGEGKCEIADENHIEIVSEDGAALTLNFYGASREDYNVVVIDKAAGTADVTQSNCSLRKDCVHMSPVTDVRGVIICTPHAMKIKAAGYAPDPDDPDIGPPME